MTGPEYKSIRLGFGMTQVQFAKLLGISQPAIANWERSRNGSKYAEKFFDLQNFGRMVMAESIERWLTR